RDEDPRPPRERLADALCQKEILLLLDNFEHVAAAAPEIGALLAACHGLNILVTSRAALRLRGEWVIPVAPLALPPATQPPTVEALAMSPAVALFVQRARARRPDFRLTAESGPAVA